MTGAVRWSEPGTLDIIVARWSGIETIDSLEGLEAVDTGSSFGASS